ncbi:MAG: hypothetical protein IPJ82_21945 [Lewinellaceae bacterium]|nr:hypothetical protein [Lewinellaceae bacterium]
MRNLSVSPEGKILASGYNGGNNMHLVCLSPEGKLLWKREIALEGEVEAGYHNRQFNYAIWTSDGCILVGGYIYGTSPQQEYQAKIFLMKLDSVGCLEPGCNQTIITSTKEEWGNPEKNWSIAPILSAIRLHSTLKVGTERRVS